MYDFTHNIRATVFYARNVNWDNLSHVPNGICDYLSHYIHDRHTLILTPPWMK